MGILDSVKKIVKKINPFSKKDGKEVIKRLLETKIDINKEIKKKNIDDGTILFFEYEAKDQTMIFDQKPLIIVFPKWNRRNRCRLAGTVPDPDKAGWACCRSASRPRFRDGCARRQPPRRRHSRWRLV